MVLTDGAMAGISVGSIAAVGIIGFLIWRLWKHSKGENGSNPDGYEEIRSLKDEESKLEEGLENDNQMERRANEEKEWRANEEKERKANEEKERRANEEKERRAKEEKERKAKEEQEQKQRQERIRRAKEREEELKKEIQSLRRRALRDLDDEKNSDKSHHMAVGVIAGLEEENAKFKDVFGFNDGPKENYSNQDGHQTDDIDPSTPLAQFLAAAGLTEYIRSFKAKDIYLDALMLLTEEDLDNMNLPVGPRLKLLKAIQKGKTDKQD